VLPDGFLVEYGGLEHILEAPATRIAKSIGRVSRHGSWTRVRNRTKEVMAVQKPSALEAEKRVYSAKTFTTVSLRLTRDGDL
jgi:hypothetical protein